MTGCRQDEKEDEKQSRPAIIKSRKRENIWLQRCTNTHAAYLRDIITNARFAG